MRILKCKGLIILLGILLIVLVTTSCRAPSIGLQDSVEPQSLKRPVQTKEKGKELLTEEELQSTGKDRKIIKEANLNLERNDLAEAYEEVQELVKKYNGYIIDSHQWQNNNQKKYYRYTLRIPQQNFDSAIAGLKDLGKLKDERFTGRDVTREYIDLKARLSNFKAQEERYLELLDQAKDVEDILKIEKELNRVRTEIEQLEGQLKYYDNRVDLATINVQIVQPSPIIGSNWQIINSFKDAVRGFVKSINLIIILIGALLPWLLFLFLILMVGYFIFKVKRK
ncbi:DUF4349 domain-containing protein [Acetohalobium arabaticum]|uniref:Putative transmembrane anti-sigma factor n=1 Tax=Acetohalobium arabaticum (strain ATCC 49924 / DSM 5501 / Z-7288) TaxID=574087 RepID=D9QSD0_ACEAZ|nr:DUF4349 domain-containing protein [Acetohalobium arabaticum]ADL13393.1 putative transmembrane anti-sigma factor [Acetohalobium arabaticum DSM 5501]